MPPKGKKPSTFLDPGANPFQALAPGSPDPISASAADPRPAVKVESRSATPAPTTPRPFSGFGMSFLPTKKGSRSDSSYTSSICSTLLPSVKVEDQQAYWVERFRTAAAATNHQMSSLLSLPLPDF